VSFHESAEKMDINIEKIKNDFPVEFDEACQTRLGHVGTNHAAVNRAISRIANRVGKHKRILLQQQHSHFTAPFTDTWNRLKLG
jgi:hypothetical protein